MITAIDTNVVVALWDKDSTLSAAAIPPTRRGDPLGQSAVTAWLRGTEIA
jgi:hypothetical protein